MAERADMAKNGTLGTQGVLIVQQIQIRAVLVVDQDHVGITQQFSQKVRIIGRDNAALLPGIEDMKRKRSARFRIRNRTPQRITAGMFKLDNMRAKSREHLPAEDRAPRSFRNLDDAKTLAGAHSSSE